MGKRGLAGRVMGGAYWDGVSGIAGSGGCESRRAGGGMSSLSCLYDAPVYMLSLQTGALGGVYGFGSQVAVFLICAACHRLSRAGSSPPLIYAPPRRRWGVVA